MILTTEEFWKKMCHPAFRRLSRLSGQIYGDIYFTLEAPEDQDGFLERMIEKAIGCLR